MKLDRNAISDLLDAIPKMRSGQSRLSHVRFLLWRLGLKVKNYPGLDSPTVVTINPERIQHFLTEGRFRQLNSGASIQVLSGNWDLLSGKIDKLSTSELLKKKMQDNSGVDGQKNRISVAIGRNGDLLLTEGWRPFLDGRRSSGISDSSSVKGIPVEITARHSRWQEMRKELYALALEKRLYQPSTHPDCDLPNEFYLAQKEYCDNRFRIIDDNLSIHNGSLLDIGACFGYFCHRFEEMGFKCCAVELNPLSLYYMRKLRQAEHRKFEIIAQDVLKWRDLRGIRFDVVLALNVFHHFLKRKRTYDGLVNLLNRLQTRELFVQSPIFNEPVTENSYKNYAEEDFAEFILQNSGLKKAKLLGTTFDGRKLFKLF